MILKISLLARSHKIIPMIKLRAWPWEGEGILTWNKWDRWGAVGQCLKMRLASLTLWLRRKWTNSSSLSSEWLSFLMSLRLSISLKGTTSVKNCPSKSISQIWGTLITITQRCLTIIRLEVISAQSARKDSINIKSILNSTSQIWRRSQRERGYTHLQNMRSLN